MTCGISKENNPPKQINSKATKSQAHVQRTEGRLPGGRVGEWAKCVKEIKKAQTSSWKEVLGGNVQRGDGSEQSWPV